MSSFWEVEQGVPKYAKNVYGCLISALKAPWKSYAIIEIVQQRDFLVYTHLLNNGENLFENSKLKIEPIWAFMHEGYNIGTFVVRQTLSTISKVFPAFVEEPARLIASYSVFVFQTSIRKTSSTVTFWTITFKVQRIAQILSNYQ